MCHHGVILVGESYLCHESQQRSMGPRRRKGRYYYGAKFGKRELLPMPMAVFGKRSYLPMPMPRFTKKDALFSQSQRRSMEPRHRKGRFYYGAKFGKRESEAIPYFSRSVRSNSLPMPMSRFGRDLQSSPRRRFGDSRSDTKVTRSTRFRNNRKSGFKVRRLGRDALIGYYDNDESNVGVMQRRAVRPQNGRMFSSGRFGRNIEEENEIRAVRPRDGRMFSSGRFGRNIEDENEIRAIRLRKGRKGRIGFFIKKHGREMVNENEIEENEVRSIRPKNIFYAGRFGRAIEEENEYEVRSIRPRKGKKGRKGFFGRK